MSPVPGILSRQGVKELLYRTLFALWPVRPKVERPVFVIGCPRSGTTILCRVLGAHPDIVALNEPRHIWAYQPKTWIWGARGRKVGGKLVLTAEDAPEGIVRKIRKAFGVMLSLGGGKVLVEKLPINSFRIPFIRSIFPQARFILIIRNGVDTAFSIARKADSGVWFAHEDYKWELLSELARERGEGSLLEVCTSNVLRGLMEWRLNVSWATRELGAMGSEAVHEVRYEEFLTDPEGVCGEMEKFVGLCSSAEMRQFAVATVHRVPRPNSAVELRKEVELIAGDLLARLGYESSPFVGKEFDGGD